MGTRAVLVILVLVARVAAAPHKMFVLRSDSTTDWATRTHVEKTVLGLARNIDRGVSRGETTFDDLAISIGCTKGLDGCRVALLDTLMIDELVAITIVPAGDDKVKVTVRRASRASVREASATVDKADPDKALIASIGPLFGAHAVVGEPQHATAPAKNVAVMTTGTPEVDNELPPDRHAGQPPAKPVETKTVETRSIETKPVETRPAEPPPPPKPVETPAPPPTVTAAPDNVVPATDRSDSPRGKYIGGMVAGGALALVGVLLWEKASSIEGDARAAPTRTSADIAALLDLESSGDHYALAGNLAFIGGLAVAGVSGYLFWRSRDGAQVTAMTVDHGGGVALTFEVP